jgi:hypothetical protein
MEVAQTMSGCTKHCIEAGNILAIIRLANQRHRQLESALSIFGFYNQGSKPRSLAPPWENLF